MKPCCDEKKKQPCKHRHHCSCLPGLPGPQGPPGPPGTPGISNLPPNVSFSGANFASYYLRQQDGIVITRYGTTGYPTADIGAYNGNGTGNKACLSFRSFGGLTQGTGMQIQNLRQITVTCRTARTTSDTSVNKLVLNLFVKHVPGTVWTSNTPNTDADCIITVDNNPTGIPANLPSTFATYTLNYNDAIWKAVQGPTHSLPSNLFTTGVPLTAYTNSPTDTLFDGTVTDNGLPYQYEYGAICFSSGDSLSTNPTVIVISEVTITFANLPTFVFSFS